MLCPDHKCVYVWMTIFLLVLMHIINVWNYIQRFASKLTAANEEVWTSGFWDFCDSGLRQFLVCYLVGSVHLDLVDTLTTWHPHPLNFDEMNL